MTPLTPDQCAALRDAIERVRSMYAVDLFGEGREPIDALSVEMQNLISRKAARMARLTCDNIQREIELEDEDE